jgi:hypothetical protein
MQFPYWAGSIVHEHAVRCLAIHYNRQKNVTWWGGDLLCVKFCYADLHQDLMAWIFCPGQLYFGNSQLLKRRFSAVRNPRKDSNWRAGNLAAWLRWNWVKQWLTSRNDLQSPSLRDLDDLITSKWATNSGDAISIIPFLTRSSNASR